MPGRDKQELTLRINFMHSWIQFYSSQYNAFANYLDQLFLDYDRIQLDQLLLAEPFKLEVVKRFGVAS